MTNVSSIQDSQDALSQAVCEKLRHAAADATKWDVILRPNSPSAFPKRVSAARQSLYSLERRISAHAHEHSDSQQASLLLEMRQNPRMIRSAIASVAEKPQNHRSSSGRVVLSGQSDEPRTGPLQSRVPFAPSTAPSLAQTFCMFMERLQEHEPLLLEELWNLSLFLNCHR